MDHQSTPEIIGLSDQEFNLEIDSIIKRAEETRLSSMQKYRDRSFSATTMTILFVVLGASAAGWFFLYETNIVLSLLSIIVTIIPPIFLSGWAETPIKLYKDSHKSEFMPAMAKAMGGLKYHPKGGISSKILIKTGVVPAHKNYKAEDFFSGNYKGTKFMMSEARLTHPRRSDQLIFDGLFVLLNIPKMKFEGHSVLTADPNVAKRIAKKLQPADLKERAYSKLFSLYSSKPNKANAVLNANVLKELQETSDLFQKSQITAVFFRKTQIFLMIPYEEDMFEASNIFVPVTTKDAAVRCKREVEQLLSIIDILDVYNNEGEELSKDAPLKDSEDSPR